MKKLVSRPKKSIGEQFREDAFFLIIGCFIIYLFEKFIDFLFKPLCILSDEEIENQFKEKIESKRNARIKRLDRISNTETDPMYQFSLRFIDAPENFKNDPNNRIYKKWFEEWKKGNIIDSTLRWAPHIFAHNERLNPAFINYMKIQLDLHKQASFLKRMQFSNTIFKYYPELSPGLKNLENDLVNYETENQEQEMQEKLQQEIQKFGLPENAAEYLSNANITSHELRKAAKFMKKYIEENISTEVCIHAYENNIEEEAIAIVNEITERTGLPPRVGYAYFKKEITTEELKEIYDSIKFAMESYGRDIYAIPEGENKTIFDSFVDIDLEKYKREKRAKKILKRG